VFRSRSRSTRTAGGGVRTAPTAAPALAERFVQSGSRHLIVRLPGLVGAACARTSSRPAQRAQPGAIESRSVYQFYPWSVFGPTSRRASRGLPWCTSPRSRSRGQGLPARLRRRFDQTLRGARALRHAPARGGLRSGGHYCTTAPDHPAIRATCAPSRARRAAGARMRLASRTSLDVRRRDIAACCSAWHRRIDVGRASTSPIGGASDERSARARLVNDAASRSPHAALLFAPAPQLFAADPAGDAPPPGAVCGSAPAWGRRAGVRSPNNRDRSGLTAISAGRRRAFSSARDCGAAGVRVCLNQPGRYGANFMMTRRNRDGGQLIAIRRSAAADTGPDRQREDHPRIEEPRH